jgi:hypothetical protein
MNYSFKNVNFYFSRVLKSLLKRLIKIKIWNDHKEKNSDTNQNFSQGVVLSFIIFNDSFKILTNLKISFASRILN